MMNSYIVIGVKVFVKQLFVCAVCYWALISCNLPVTGLIDNSNELIAFLECKV